MKKRITILSIAAMLSTLTLASCGKGYTYKDGIMLYVNDKPLTTEEVFATYGGMSSSEGWTQSGISTYYDAINNINIEADIAKDDEMDRTVKSKMDAFYQAAKDDAANNGTNQSAEIEKALKTAGFKTVQELEDSYYLAEKKSKADSNYQTNSMYTTDEVSGSGMTIHKAFISQMIGGYNDDNGNKVKGFAPYHVKHILAKFDTSGSSSIYQGTISASDARKVDTITSRLAAGTTFGIVANSYSDDDSGDSTLGSSKSNYGDSGIMTTATGFVNEFKYGIYTYDAFFNSALDAAGKERVYTTTFAQNKTYAEYESLIGERAFGIPYSAVQALGYFADMTKASNGAAVKDASEYHYPRNIFYNNYFNYHGLSFIYLDEVSEAPVVTDNTYYTASDYSKVNTTDDTKTGFRTVDGISDRLFTLGATAGGYRTEKKDITSSKKILTDENGNPILVTRAGTGSGDTGYQGLHFIVLQMNPFTYKTTDSTGVELSNFDSVKQYYTLDRPSTSSTSNVKSYVSFITSTERDVYSARVSNLKSSTNTCLPSLTYEQFKYYLTRAETGNNDNNIKITIEPSLRSKIMDYVNYQIQSNLDNTERTYQASWESYLQLLGRQEEKVPVIVPVTTGINTFLSGDMNAFFDARIAEDNDL